MIFDAYDYQKKKRRLKVLFPVTRLGARQEIPDVTKELLDLERDKS
jgi:hypothetical protein